MANDATKVSVGKPNISGAVYVAPRTATLPTDATTPLSEDYKCLGFVSEDGLSNANEMEVNVIKAWGGVIVYRSLSELNDTFSLTLIETENIDVLKTTYGDANVTEIETSDGKQTKVSVRAEDPQEKIFVFELALRGNKKRRIVIQDGAVTGRDEIVYNDSDPIGYGITISAYPDATGSTHEEYTTQ